MPVWTAGEYDAYVKRDNFPWRWTPMAVRPPPHNSQEVWLLQRYLDAFDKRPTPDDVRDAFMALAIVDLEAAYQYAENWRTIFGYG